MSREFSKMQFRDRISRIIHHTILIMSPSSMIQRVQGSKTLIRTWSRYCRTLRISSHPFPMFHPNPQEDYAKFFEFSKKAEDGPSRAGRLSKTSPEVPMEFHVSSGNPESRWDSDSSRVGWERGMLQSGSLFQDRKILLRRSRNSLCSANPESESRVDSQ